MKSGNYPLELQPKLLRVLERREVTRIGAGDSVRVDVRVVAATHRDLAGMVDRGTFREDLLYRLAEVVVRMPTLRDHREDVPLLAARILQQLDGPKRTFAPDAVAYLMDQPWPGNVRELRNIVRRAAALSASTVLQAGVVRAPREREAEHQTQHFFHIAAAVYVLGAAHTAGRARAVERDYIARILDKYGPNLERAAAHAGIHRKSLERLIRQLRLVRRG